MRILAFSDIHGNVEAVRHLRAQESNRFDGILIAGDLGDDSVDDILSLCMSFECPVFYVYGNWDNRSAYGPRHSGASGPVHHTVQALGDLTVTGFSGCPTHWGQNPIFLSNRAEIEKTHQSILERNNALQEAMSVEIAAVQAELNQTLAADLSRLAANAKDKRKATYRRRVRTLRAKTEMAIDEELARISSDRDTLHAGAAWSAYRQASALLFSETAKANRILLDQLLSEIDASRAIVLTHERLFRFAETGIAPLMHVFGHRHTFKHTHFKGTHNVNVAALDDLAGATRVGIKDGPLHIANAGGYCVFTIDGTEVDVERIDLLIDEETWDLWESYVLPGDFIPDAIDYAARASPYLIGPEDGDKVTAS